MLCQLVFLVIESFQKFLHFLIKVNPILTNLKSSISIKVTQVLNDLHVISKLSFVVMILLHKNRGILEANAVLGLIQMFYQGSGTGTLISWVYAMFLDSSFEKATYFPNIVIATQTSNLINPILLVFIIFSFTNLILCLMVSRGRN